jgi:hypothetical protein
VKCPQSFCEKGAYSEGVGTRRVGGGQDQSELSDTVTFIVYR